MRDHVRPVSVACAVLTVCATGLLSTGAANSSPFNGNSIEPPAPTQDALRPRQMAAKPGKTFVDPERHYTDLIVVKFVDGCSVRLRNGALTDFATDELAPAAAALQRVRGGTWTRMHSINEARLETLRQTAQRNTGRAIQDFNTIFHLRLPARADIAGVCDDLNKLDIIEMARPAPLPGSDPGAIVSQPLKSMISTTAPIPLPPNFQPQQGYLDPATAGTDAECMWLLPGGAGSNVAVCDMEQNWNFNHNDLPVMTELVANPTYPASSLDHGTAVMGEMAGVSNGVGVTGACFNSTFFTAAANSNNVYNVANAITSAAGALVAGDVLLIEQHMPGPNYPGGDTQLGYVAQEWDVDVYNAIVAAVGNGIVVVAAAGNGSENLDDPVYDAGHAPFKPANDSGAIYVGGGGSPGSGAGDRSRLGFSNWGSRVNLQGWGHNVVTTGYGNLYSAEGLNWEFTAGFSGTSSASPVVTGAVACLQSAYFAQSGSYLTSTQIRSALQTTGSPQLSGGNPASQNIGPRPDAAAALAMLVPALDCNNNLVPDICDLALGTSQDCNNNGIPDECDISNGAPDCNNNGVPDNCDIASGTSQDCNNNGIPDECNDIPANATCATAQVMAINSQTNGTNINSCDDPTPYCNAFASTQSNGVWYSVIGNGSKLAASTCPGADFDTKISIFTGSCGALTCIEGDDDGCGFPLSYQEFCTMPGDTYYIFVNGFGLSEGNFTLDVTDVGSGFDCNCNGIADECDLEFNPSLDINNDGFIDSCVLCAGDTNCDGIINYLDMITVWSNMGTGGPAGDVNFDGTVNFIDYLIVAWNYGKVCL